MKSVTVRKTVRAAPPALTHPLSQTAPETRRQVPSVQRSKRAITHATVLGRRVCAMNTTNQVTLYIAAIPSLHRVLPLSFVHGQQIPIYRSLAHICSSFLQEPVSVAYRWCTSAVQSTRRMLHSPVRLEHAAWPWQPRSISPPDLQTTLAGAMRRQGLGLRSTSTRHLGAAARTGQAGCHASRQSGRRPEVSMQAMQLQQPPCALKGVCKPAQLPLRPTAPQSRSGSGTPRRCQAHQRRCRSPCCAWRLHRACGARRHASAQPTLLLLARCRDRWRPEAGCIAAVSRCPARRQACARPSSHRARHRARARRRTRARTAAA